MHLFSLPAQCLVFLLLLPYILSQKDPIQTPDPSLRTKLIPSSTFRSIQTPIPARLEQEDVVIKTEIVEVDDKDIYTSTIVKWVDKNGKETKEPQTQTVGLTTLRNAGIGIAVIVVVVLIGIFVLRKWKLSPTSRFRQKLNPSQPLRQRSDESDTHFLRELHAP